MCGGRSRISAAEDGRHQPNGRRLASWHDAHEQALAALALGPGIAAHGALETYSVLTLRRLEPDERLLDVVRRRWARIGPMVLRPERRRWSDRVQPWVGAVVLALGLTQVALTVATARGAPDLRVLGTGLFFGVGGLSLIARRLRGTRLALFVAGALTVAAVTVAGLLAGR